ncbi:nuclease homologue [Bradyrhizobium erythrophlei]|jgi:endonuclease YncB( thermonuclease family)|nr:nuclease homologue [Bradyrhizobium erythrophlei]
MALALMAHVPDVIGQASVINGDTIEIHGTRIRVFGIDAPESDQLCRNEESELYRCGQKASNALFDFIARRPLECVELDRDRYHRTVAVCSVGGTDIADWLVRNGLALDWLPSTAKAAMPTHRPKQSASCAVCGAAASQRAVELSGLQAVRWKAGRLFG